MSEAHLGHLALLDKLFSGAVIFALLDKLFQALSFSKLKDLSQEASLRLFKSFKGYCNKDVETIIADLDLADDRKQRLDAWMHQEFGLSRPCFLPFANCISLLEWLDDAFETQPSDIQQNIRLLQHIVQLYPFLNTKPGTAESFMAKLRLFYHFKTHRNSAPAVVFEDLVVADGDRIQHLDLWLARETQLASFKTPTPVF